MVVLFFTMVWQCLHIFARKNVDKCMSKMVPINVLDSSGHVEVQIHPFLTSALDERKLSASRHGRFPSRNKSKVSNH
jgi:hypothetical protein